MAKVPQRKPNKAMKGDELLNKLSKKEQGKMYKMPLAEALEEHERLTKVLRSGKSKELAKEFKIQSKELKKLKSK